MKRRILKSKVNSVSDLPFFLCLHLLIIIEHHLSSIAALAAVEGLTVNVRVNELLIHWDTSVDEVSYYVVFVRINGKEKLQINAVTHELKYESEALSGYGTIQVQVYAVYDAGVGPSATVTIPFGNTSKEQGEVLITIYS